ncbi:MAG TPA: hypothetical protein VI461_08795, partial [Chitinophagaceae bacterium]|nr:hypothetical protein [Chitinophagaceae bacterium]
MNNLNKIILGSFIFLLTGGSTFGQRFASSIKKSLIFAAVTGTISKPDSVELPANAGFVKLINGDMSFFKILSFAKRKLIIAFKPSADFIGIARAQLQAKNSLGEPITSIELTGLSTKGLEGENEPPLSRIIDALGYTVNTGWITLSNNSLPQLQGDELSFSLFHKAGKGKVEIIPVARYSPDFELAFGYYIDTASVPDKQQVGILSKAGTFPEHQCLFPAIASGTSSFDPGNQSFGFYATSPSHTAYSEDVWNMLFFPANAVHATRIYPLKDKEGRLISNTYLLCF